MIRWTLMVVAMYAICCALAVAADTVPSRDGTRERPTSYVPPDPGGRDASANPPVPTATALRRTGGSLYKATVNMEVDPNEPRMDEVSLLAVPEPKPRTLKKHDLITIIIREDSQISSAGSTDLKKTSNLDMGVDDFIHLNWKQFGQGGGIGTPPPSIVAHGSREAKNDATVDRTDSFTARLQAEVIDVKPNATVVLQAVKSIKTDDDEQEFILSGVCRAQDVTADNSVLSTQLSNMRVQKNHVGSVRDATKRGWLTKLLDVLNPF